MDMMGRIAQAPAMRQMAHRLAQQMDPSASSSGARGRRASPGAPETVSEVGGGGIPQGMEPLDFGAFAQQMLPLMGQVENPPPALFCRGYFKHQTSMCGQMSLCMRMTKQQCYH